MELKDWLNIFYERDRSLQKYWNFYIVVTLGVAGFAVKVLASDPFTLRLLAGIFAVYAGGNLQAMIRVVNQLHALRKRILSLEDTEAPGGYLDKLTRTTGVGGLAFFHLVVDALVIAVLLLLCVP